MDTDSIQLFVLAAEKRNISAAGRELGMAPAVASARLAKLEHQLGADLLRRSTRKVSLSLEGEEFLPFARDIIAQQKAAFAALGKGEISASGTLRVSAPSSFAQQYLTPALPAFLQMHPELKIDLRLSDSQADLIEGSFDIAVRNAALPDSSLKARKLTSDTRILCASPNYLKHNGTPTTAADLATHQFVTFRQRASIPLLGKHADEPYLFEPQRQQCRLYVDDGSSLRVATVAGAGIAVNSLWSVQSHLLDGSLVRVLPDYTVASHTALWLVYPKANVLTTKVRVFIDYLVDEIKNNIPG